MKICKTCNQEKLKTDFYVTKAGYYYGSCKRCTIDRNKERSKLYCRDWRKRNPGYHRNYYLNSAVKAPLPYVYMVTTPDSKYYIGKTTLNIEKRMACHRHNVSCSLYKYMQSNAYDFDDLEYNILIEASSNHEARQIETAIIKSFRVTLSDQLININN